MDKVEEILRCLLDNLNEGIHIVDEEGKTIYYNESMGRMEGLNPKEVIGKTVVEYLKGVEEESSTLMNALSSKKKITDVVQHYRSHNGKKVTTINTTIPVMHNCTTIAAIEIAKDMTQLKELNEKLCKLQSLSGASNKHFSFNDIIGNNELTKKAINKAARASLANSSVLIYGETGVGKEVFAQSIHYSGVRKDKPFIPINCAAIPSTLLEGMLFGTVKGSFTGAENKKGLFEEANGGTILLDEINSMEPFLQSKLLRVLQDGYIRPIGSNNVIDIDVRVIATLNEEPEKLIRDGKLRKDFYYRLSVIRIDIPSLRERKEDIPLLCTYFLEYYNKVLGKNVNKIDEEVIKTFNDHDWPGNIRELKNVIQGAMDMAENIPILTKEYFESNAEKNISISIEEDDVYDLKGNSLLEHLENIEKDIIAEALEKNNYNISKTSNELKITRQNLQHKIKKYKLL